MKKRLGDLLLENREITEEQLNEALEIQSKEGKLLGVILTQLGYMDDETLLDYLKMQGTRIHFK